MEFNCDEGPRRCALHAMALHGQWQTAAAGALGQPMPLPTTTYRRPALLQPRHPLSLGAMVPATIPILLAVDAAILAHSRGARKRAGHDRQLLCHHRDSGWNSWLGKATALTSPWPMVNFTSLLTLMAVTLFAVPLKGSVYVARPARPESIVSAPPGLGLLMLDPGCAPRSAALFRQRSANESCRHSFCGLLIRWRPLQGASAR